MTAPHAHALALETFRLTKRFGAFTALDEVSLSVRPGTVHALLGENGAGKSTTVKCWYTMPMPSARGDLPAVIRWKAVRRELEAFMAQAPFALPLDALPIDLAAGERQKLEILKQLFLRPRLLVLDEPTSVLTPQVELLEDLELLLLAGRARAAGSRPPSSRGRR